MHGGGIAIGDLLVLLLLLLWLWLLFVVVIIPDLSLHKVSIVEVKYAERFHA